MLTIKVKGSEGSRYKVKTSDSLNPIAVYREPFSNQYLTLQIILEMNPLAENGF